MAISWVGSTGFQASASALSVAVSTTGAQSGDLLIAFVNSAAQQTVGTLPQLDGNNFTSLDLDGTGTPAAAGGVDLQVSYKWFTGGATLTMADLGSYQSMVVVALRGVDTTTPFSGVTSRVDASATTTCTFPITQAPSSTQWLCHAIGLDKDTSSNPYAAFSALPSNGIGGLYNIFPSGTHTFYDGSITNAGVGGGLWGLFFNNDFNNGVAGTFVDSTTHAYVSFYINEASTSQNATFSATTTGAATASTTGTGSLTGTILSTVYVDGAVITSVTWTAAGTAHKNVVLNTDPSSASAVGNAGSMTGSSGGGGDITLTTLVGSATAGTTGTGSFVGSATLAATTVGTASAVGNTNTPALKGNATFAATSVGTATAATTGTGTLKGNATLAATTVGTASAVGGDSIFRVSKTFAATTVGTASADGGTSTPALKGSATFAATTFGAATSNGGTSTPALTGTATFAATTVGNADASGGTGSMSGAAGQVDVTLTTAFGSATADGAAGAFRTSVTVTTTFGSATAEGVSGSSRGTANLTTQASTATADGAAGSSRGTALLTTVEAVSTASGAAGSSMGGAKLATAVADATGSGLAGAFTGSGTLGTQTGVATATGASGALKSDVSLSTVVGTASAVGIQGQFAVSVVTVVGTASATGAEGVLKSDATFTTVEGTSSAVGGTGEFRAGGADGTLGTAVGTADASGVMGAWATTSVVQYQVSANATTASGTDWVNPTNATGVPNDTYATWTKADAATSPPLVIAGFGAWADIPAGATIDGVTITVQHHESHTGAPLTSVTQQAYLGASPVGTASNLVLSATDRDDSITPTLTLGDLQGDTLALHVVAARS